MARIWIALTLVASLCSCTAFAGDPYVIVTSDPPGARVLVDGEDTGMTTPCQLDLGGMLAGDHDITLQRKGFREETRTVYHYTEAYTSRWVDGSDTLVVFYFPVFWTTGDFIFPFGVRWTYVPHELMVKLYREGEAAPDGIPDQEAN